MYAKGAQNLAGMLAAGILTRDAEPCYYVYRLTMGSHVQTGVAAAASIAAYDANRIRRHELTRPEKENDRVHQIDALNAQTGPVLMAYPDAPQVNAMLAEAAAGSPDVDVAADDGIVHRLWVVRDARKIATLTASLRCHVRALHRGRPPPFGRSLSRGGGAASRQPTPHRRGELRAVSCR